LYPFSHIDGLARLGIHTYRLAKSTATTIYSGASYSWHVAVALAGSAARRIYQHIYVVIGTTAIGSRYATSEQIANTT